MTRYLMISIGGVLGANTRFLLGGWISERTVGSGAFPWGTFVINVTGSFILGLFMTLNERFVWNGNWRLLVAVGFLGAYTTFSTFEYESMRLLMTGSTRLGLQNIVGSVAVGLFGVWLGIVVARLRTG